MLKELNRTTAGPAASHPVKVLQFGEGNFLRAFVDWMIDILNEKTSFDGAVQVVQPIRNGLTEALQKQDGLYHVLLKGVQQGQLLSETRLIHCIADAFNPYDDFQRFLRAAENPELQWIVSNTTEAGIAFNEADTTLSILAESFPGKLTQLLHHRFNFFKGDPKKGLMILPCELIEKNGENLKEAILQYVTHWKLSKDFLTWLEEANVFCNTLVDRIVPGFPKDNITEIQTQLGYDDNLVVQAEPFHLWVIEAPASVEQKLPVKQAGLNVQFVSDLTPYRTRKVRILNGAHTAMVPVAYLAGLRMVKESVDDEAIGRYIRNTIFDEIIPTLDLPSDELQQFARDVIERFQNPFIKHELLSISLNSISKFKVRVLPSLLGYIKIKGTFPENLIYALACLIRFYKGEWNGAVIPLNDSPDVLTFFENAWQENNRVIVVEKVLGNETFWGINLNAVEGLQASVVKSLSQIER